MVVSEELSLLVTALWDPADQFPQPKEPDNKELSLGRQPQNGQQTCVKASPWELWNMAEGEVKDATYQGKTNKRMVPTDCSSTHGECKDGIH